MSEPPITYGWLIERLDAEPLAGDELANVVRMIHWRLFATDGLNTVDTFGEAPLVAPDPAEFVPFDELTPAAVTDWAEAAIDASAGEDQPSVSQLRAALAGILAARRGPQLVPMQPPWEG